MSSKIQIRYFQRKPRPGFNFSMEYIFNDIRNRLKDKVDAEVIISPMYNDGYYSKLINIIGARIKQCQNINHITGEVHFLNFLMEKNRVVLTILDCGMMLRKKGLAKNIVKWLYLSAPVKKAKFVTTISEVAKQEIIHYTGCSAEKIIVIPVAVDSIYQPVPKTFNELEPNILQVGTGYNKNLYRLMEALEGIKCKLTIIGKLSQEHKDELSERKIFYENFYNLTQEDIYGKYIECDILSFVSTFEGFGMPIVEANAVERVVLTSNLSSMPEVARNSACLVDPFNVNEIRMGILRLISDGKYREQLIQNGRLNKLRFNADTIANSYYEVYMKMLKNSKDIVLGNHNV